METVKQFKYLGAIISDNGSKPEIAARTAQTMTALARLKIIWKDKNITLMHKIRLQRALILSIFLYACETWTLNAELQKKIRAVEMRSLRIILGISYRDHITNETIRQTVEEQLGPYDDLLTIVKKRKLKWYGHVTRSTGLAKVILQGTVEGKRRRGRQRKLWTDNIQEWTGLTFARSQVLAHDRQKWSEMVQGLSHQRPNDSIRN